MIQVKRKNVLQSIFGLLIRGIGVGFMMFASLGLNPATVFQEGFSMALSFPYGFGAVIVNIVILFFVYLIDRRYIHISSMLAIFIIGYTADYTSQYLLYIFKNTNLLIRFLMLGFGCFTMSLGTVIYTGADLGVGALDVFPELIADKTKYNFATVRIIVDGISLMVGFILGGSIGIGTIVSLIVLGPIIQGIRGIKMNIRISNLDYIS